MTDTNDGTAPVGTGAPADASAAAAAPATPDELASLRSRNSGLNAKVTELQQQLTARDAELGTARKGLTDKESADADLRAQLSDLQAKLDAQTAAAEVATLQGRFPEAFAELGENIRGLSPEKLAALEARLAAKADTGAEQEVETPRPVGNNPQRTTGGSKPIEDMTSEELRQSLRDMPREAFGVVG